MRRILICLVIAAVLQSCVCDCSICTEEFRTIGVTITGGTLDDFYTVRISTGDTIVYSEQQIVDSSYPILDDSFHSEIINSQETFYFNGIVNDEIVIDEDYVIEGDDCHINLISGTTEIDL